MEGFYTNNQRQSDVFIIVSNLQTGLKEVTVDLGTRAFPMFQLAPNNLRTFMDSLDGKHCSQEQAKEIVTDVSKVLHYLRPYQTLNLSHRYVNSSNWSVQVRQVLGHLPKGTIWSHLKVWMVCHGIPVRAVREQQPHGQAMVRKVKDALWWKGESWHQVTHESGVLEKDMEWVWHNCGKRHCPQPQDC